MVGTATPPAGHATRRKILVIIVAALAASAAVGIGAVWFLFFRQPPNTPPHGLSIAVTPPSGDNETVFNFVAEVSDDRDVSTVQVRWDWEDDGVWDTAWATNRSATKVFSQPGSYTVRLAAQDTGGLAVDATRQVTVTHIPLRVGSVLPLTGVLTFFGVSQQKAVTMAISEINAAGGVLGQPIRGFHADDRSRPAAAYEAASTLIHGDKVVGIVGSLGSSSCAEMLPLVQSTRVFLIAPGCTSPTFSDLSVTGGWFARTAATPALQSVVAASYARSNRSFTRAGVIAMDNAYGRGLAAAFVSNFTRFGGMITSGSPRLASESTADYTSDLQGLLNVNPAPQIVYAPFYAPQASSLMRDWWNGIGANPDWGSVAWLFTDGAFDQSSFIDPLVSAGVDVSGFRGTIPAVYAGITPPRYAAWAARYQSLFGEAPGLFAAHAYDATYLMALAAQAGGYAQGDSIRRHVRAVANPPGTVVGPNEWRSARDELAAARDLDFEGASGAVNLDTRGDAVVAIAIWGVDASNALVVEGVFPESLVASLLPPGFTAYAWLASGRAPLLAPASSARP